MSYNHVHIKTFYPDKIHSCCFKMCKSGRVSPIPSSSSQYQSGHNNDLWQNHRQLWTSSAQVVPVAHSYQFTCFPLHFHFSGLHGAFPISLFAFSVAVFIFSPVLSSLLYFLCSFLFASFSLCPSLYALS